MISSLPSRWHARIPVSSPRTPIDTQTNNKKNLEVIRESVRILIKKHDCNYITDDNEKTRQWPVSVSVPLSDNRTSSTKPEVYVMHCTVVREGMSHEPRPHVIRAENFMRFGRVGFEICERADRQTRKWQYFACLPGAK